MLCIIIRASLGASKEVRGRAFVVIRVSKAHYDEMCQFDDNG
jgi:hypothetical protein